MSLPNVKFIATERTKNNKPDWKSTMNSIFDNVKEQFNNTVDYQWGTFGGSVITDRTIDFDDSCRNKLDNGHTGCLKPYVKVELTNEEEEQTDTAVVFDHHNYSSFAGIAEIGNEDYHAYDSVRACLVGKDGYSEYTVLHEIVHTLNGRHENMTTNGQSYSTGTVMSYPQQYNTGCNGHRNYISFANKNVSQIGQCDDNDNGIKSTEEMVTDFMANHLGGGP